MVDSLEERLKSHAKAFDSLLSLIPAKYYYGQDTGDQWKKKKQTKAQARQAKIAKLDPDSAQSAKDVLDMRAKKRKRDGDGDEDDDDVSDVEGIEAEKPREGLKQAGQKKKKKVEKKDDSLAENADQANTALKPSKTGSNENSAQELRKIKQDEKKKRREQKKAKKADKQNKKQAQQLQTEEADPGSGDELAMDADKMDFVEHEPQSTTAANTNENHVPPEKQSPPVQSTVSPTPAPDSPNFDQSAGQSAASSASSIVPPPTHEQTKEPVVDSATTHEKLIKKPLVDSDILRTRLHAKIEVLRAARKADNPDGTRARNRQELMEARRRKEEQRRAHKRELRMKAKEEERLARERSMVSPIVRSPVHASLSLTAGPENNFLFGRIAFNDGQQVDTTHSTIMDKRVARKGPQDPLGALKAAESKRARLNGLDAQKRKDIEEKDLWLTARKRIQGEKVRDDVSLLKKTLKRQEKGKSKSGTEWKDRISGVEKSKEMKQRKREENLKKRKEEKGGKGKKKGKVQKKRPGFEGSFRTKPRPKSN
ncbi:MAG: hypothetical protein M1816_008183 [Peltula sp. TS41687]|nr:MAG: hypothetical protein M1816_008183 [Peltula sp. TS41687]